MERSIDFLFSGTAPQPSAEAAARRRIRALQMVHPGVKEWDVEVCAGDGGETKGPEYAARVAARIGNEAVRGNARGNDVLSALRLAFNAVEQELDAQREGARTRAAQWLSAVRGRIGIRQGFF